MVSIKSVNLEAKNRGHSSKKLNVVTTTVNGYCFMPPRSSSVTSE